MYSGYKSYARCMTCKDFLPFCELTLCFLDGGLWSPEVVLILIKSSWLFLLLCVLVVTYRRACCLSWLLKISSYVFLLNLIVLTLIFSCLIHSELILCRFWSRGAASFIFMWISGGPAPFVKRTIPFPLSCSDTHVKNQVTLNVSISELFSLT